MLTHSLGMDAAHHGGDVESGAQRQLLHCVCYQEADRQWVGLQTLKALPQ